MAKRSLRRPVVDAEKQVRRAIDTLSLPRDNRVLNYRQRLLDTKRVTSPTFAAVAEPILGGPSADGKTTSGCSNLR